MEKAEKRTSGPNVGNEAPGVGAHCGGMGQMKRVTLIEFDGTHPEVVRVSDPFSGYAETIVNTNTLTLTQDEYDVYAAMTTQAEADAYIT